MATKKKTDTTSAKTKTVKKPVRPKKTVAAKTVKKATAAKKPAAAKKAAAAKKPVAAKKPAAAKKPVGLAVSSEERSHLIAVAAYLRAESRGFTHGDEVSDWLLAEQEVDARLTAS